jgi:hypothetical protein
LLVSCLAYSLMLKVEVVCSLKMWGCPRTAWLYNPEGRTTHSHCSENRIQYSICMCCFRTTRAGMSKGRAVPCLCHFGLFSFSHIPVQRGWQVTARFFSAVMSASVQWFHIVGAWAGCQ